VQFNGSKPTVLKNEPVTQVFVVNPKYPNTVQISKEEFDTLDVSTESMTAKLNRERTLARIKKLKTSIDVSPLSSEEIVKKFQEIKP